MKKNLLKGGSIAFMAFFAVALLFTGCKKDEPVVTADTSTLTTLLDSCQTLLDSATTDEYPQAAITAFQTVVTTANTALEDKTIAQTAVDNLVVQLRSAKETFLATAYDAIPASALLMGMTFDETVTNSQFTTEGKGWTAVLKPGPSEIFGTNTGLPTFATGKVGKAMYFSKGSHLEISDYASSDLLGSQLSISLWVKPDSTRENNYMVSYNYWNSWKFQLQTQNKPFFTIHTNADGWVDADNQADFSAPNNEWTQLVVTLNLNTQVLTFYVNGVSSMVWTVNDKPGLTGTGAWDYKNTLPLLIGEGFTYSEGMASMSGDSWWQNEQSFPHYVGLIDNLKIYNIALSDGQVARLYKEENK